MKTTTATKRPARRGNTAKNSTEKVPRPRRAPKVVLHARPPLAWRKAAGLLDVESWIKWQLNQACARLDCLLIPMSHAEFDDVQRAWKPRAEPIGMHEWLESHLCEPSVSKYVSRSSEKEPAAGNAPIEIVNPPKDWSIQAALSGYPDVSSWAVDVLDVFSWSGDRLVIRPGAEKIDQCRKMALAAGVTLYQWLEGVVRKSAVKGGAA